MKVFFKQIFDAVRQYALAKSSSIKGIVFQYMNNNLAAYRLIIFFLCFFLPHPSEADWKQYNPVIQIGAKTGWKNILFVFWSHDTLASSWALRSVVRELSAEVRHKDLSIILYQVAGPDDESISRASLFVCVPQNNYPKLVLRYLDLLSHRGGAIDESAFENDFANAAKGLDLPKRWEDCIEGPNGVERIQTFKIWREEVTKKWIFDRAPFFVLNGKEITVKQVVDIKSKLLKK